MNELTNLLGVVYTVAFITCYWPQIIKIHKTKSVEDISLPLFQLSVVGYIAAIFYTLLRVGPDFWWLLNYGVSLVGAGYVCVQYENYKKNSKKRTKIVKKVSKIPRNPQGIM